MNFNEILYGVAYYDEYMPYDRIETDFIRSQKRRTRKGDCPAALRKLRFAGVQRKGIPSV